jgi:hypothetical protein
MIIKVWAPLDAARAHLRPVGAFRCQEDGAGVCRQVQCTWTPFGCWFVESWGEYSMGDSPSSPYKMRGIPSQQQPSKDQELLHLENKSYTPWA